MVAQLAYGIQSLSYAMKHRKCNEGITAAQHSCGTLARFAPTLVFKILVPWPWDNKFRNVKDLESGS